jgi:hypothetical protein
MKRKRKRECKVEGIERKENQYGKRRNEIEE